MRNYAIFLKKEIVEALKTYRLLILGAVLLLLGMMSPLVARFTPEILKWAMESDPATAGMDLSAMLTLPTAFDSWVQFYSNVGLMGYIALVIVFSGMVSSETSKGTLTIMLSKGLSRTSVILSKLTNAVLVWTGGYCLAAVTAWGYTVYMFEGRVPNLLFALFGMWLFGVFLLAVTALASTLTDKSFICLVAVGVAVVILNLISIIPGAGKYNPVALSGTSIALLTDDMTPRALLPALIVAGLGIAAFSIAAIIAFNKKNAGRKSIVLAGAVVFCMALTVLIGEGVPRQIMLSRHVASEKVIIGAGTQWELSGILTIPKNAECAVPAVVLVHGSGPNDMDETIFDNKPFREIAEYLSRNGIAVIRYNKRTLTHGAKMAESGDFTIWEETIEDALLATKILRDDPRIDRDRVYILGHSFGGMLAPQIHVMGGDFAGLILFASSPRFLLDISGDQVLALVAATEDEDEKAAILLTHRQMEEEFEKILTMPDDEVKNTRFEHWGNMGYYLKDLYRNPVAKYLESVTVPILVIQPGDDVQVLTDVDFAMYKELLSGRSNVSLRLYPGLNHLFMPSTGRDISEIFDEYRIKARVDPQVLRDTMEWIKAEK